MDQELEPLRRAYLADRSNEALGRDYERRWLRSQSLDLTGQIVDLKFVYEGCALSGKTSNFESLQQRFRKHSTPLFAGSADGDRVLCFALSLTDLECLEEWRGLTLRIGFYTIPGACYYGKTRRLIRSGCDGFVFIPSRQRHLLDQSVEIFEEIKGRLESPRYKNCGLVFQRNEGQRMDVSWDEVKDALDFSAPVIRADAMRSVGVDETYLALLKQLIGDPVKRIEFLPKRLQAESAFVPNLPEDLFVQAIR